MGRTFLPELPTPRRSSLACFERPGPMAKLVHRTHFPTLDPEKQRQESLADKVSPKVTRKKGSGSKASTVVTSPPASSHGNRKRTTKSAKSKDHPVVQRSPSLVNVIKLQNHRGSPKSPINLKDEKPEEAEQLPSQTVELKSGTNFYLPKRKLVNKPIQPFTFFIDEKNGPAKLVWLYLLESQMPFKKISIKSKEGEKASGAVPSYCKHCIFVDGDNSLGQPTAIIRHICNNYTNNLLMGADKSQISQGFSWLHWAVSVLHRDLFYLSKGEEGVCLSSAGRRGTQGELLKSSLDSVSLYFDMLEKIFQSRRFLLGEVAWFCDSSVALVLRDAAGFSLAAWPRVIEWLGRVKNQPHWRMVNEL